MRATTRLHAVLHVLDEPHVDPRAAADAPLAGVPYVLKDTWDTAGDHDDRRLVASSRTRARRLAATRIARSQRRGAVLLGKSNLCDLAFSTESDNHLRGPVRNPHDPTRTAGGSTGGGAAAVADGMAAFDWGTDFGGSIRAPSAFCGVVGLRLSHAAWPVGIEHFPRISPFFWDFCGMGPLTRDGRRCARRHARGERRAPQRQSRTSRWIPIASSSTAPDAAHDGGVADVRRGRARPPRERRREGWSITRELPSPTEVNALFTEYFAAHFKEFIAGDELPLAQGLPAVLLGLVSGGRLDKRVHPNTGLLFAGAAALSLRYRNRDRAATRLADAPRGHPCDLGSRAPRRHTDLHRAPAEARASGLGATG